MKYILLILLSFSFLACSKDEQNKNGSEGNAQPIANVPQNGTETAIEAQLYELIMEYRRQNGLGGIPYSKNLSIVGQIHAKDLADNKPNQGNCNLHSWSNKGKWTPLCYTNDHAQSKLMWSKPSELTSYKGLGYEISAMNHLATAESFLTLWKKSSAHNDLILNKGMWKQEWKAIGIGVYKGYAMVWFGHQADNN